MRSSILIFETVPKAMRTRLREYFTHCKVIFRTKYYHEVLDNMSPALQGEVAKHSHSSWLYKIPFFMANNEEERDRFVVCIALDLVRFKILFGIIYFSYIFSQQNFFI